MLWVDQRSVSTCMTFPGTLRFSRYAIFELAFLNQRIFLQCYWAAGQTKLRVSMCLHRILRSACASAKSDQSSAIALWIARSSAILSGGKLRH